MEKNLGTAGFYKILVKRISTVLHYQSAEETCAAAFEGGPVAVAYFKFTPYVQKEIYHEYLASI